MKRFDTFKKETMPIVEMYEAQGKTKRINALRSVDEVYADVTVSLTGFI